MHDCIRNVVCNAKVSVLTLNFRDIVTCSFFLVLSCVPYHVAIKLLLYRNTLSTMKILIPQLRRLFQHAWHTIIRNYYLSLTSSSVALLYVFTNFSLRISAAILVSQFLVGAVNNFSLQGSVSSEISYVRIAEGRHYVQLVLLTKLT